MGRSLKTKLYRTKKNFQISSSPKFDDKRLFECPIVARLVFTPYPAKFVFNNLAVNKIITENVSLQLSGGFVSSIFRQTMN